MKLGYVYTYACHEDEKDLCQLELRVIFGIEPANGYIESSLYMDPSRSPFIKQRVSLLFSGTSSAELAEQVTAVELNEATFKVVYTEAEWDASVKLDFEEKRSVEREIGWQIQGKADMRTPERTFAVICLDNRWLFGECVSNKAIWLAHKNKPQNYSTALNTRLARAVVNIAIPQTEGIKAIDPCCGIGTVLIEARSMGIDMVGYDLNPLAVIGARANLAHFGLESNVTIGDMRSIQGSFDAAILDLPYNLCSVSSPEEQLEMLQSARGFARRVVIVTIEAMDELIINAGFMIQDRCIVSKGSFLRQVIVCI
ncbi:methyltransferase domain-containing protein [Paenibacillus psychroresistens]|uniref:Methyltransferase domain-containing protein n=1 Tax=Paenibacillus psychroresistens TaxID=1778678 RepID=A0A6B8RS35_9BACL|nr:methyltransferase domain-containing protein [Paenibacillus psychroresistens]QGQ98273.1 methyltransferase domain-containing protein [Paenibacillus psychroresistens]